MVLNLLGELADFVREREGLLEILEFELAFEVVVFYHAPGRAEFIVERFESGAFEGSRTVFTGNAFPFRQFVVRSRHGCNMTRG